MDVCVMSCLIDSYKQNIYIYYHNSFSQIILILFNETRAKNIFKAILITKVGDIIMKCI